MFGTELCKCNFGRNIFLTNTWLQNCNWKWHLLMNYCFLILSGQPPLLAPPQSPNPAITAIYPSTTVTLATGVVSAATVPPGVVYTVSSPSILPKQTSATSATPTTLPAPDRPAHGPAHAELDRQTDKLPLSHTDRLNKVGSSSTAPLPGATLSLQPVSPAQSPLAGRNSFLSGSQKI